MELTKKQPTMNYSMIINRVELDSDNLNDLIEIAIDYGVCPSTEIYKNGVPMRETMADFIQY